MLYWVRRGPIFSPRPLLKTKLRSEVAEAPGPNPRIEWTVSRTENSLEGGTLLRAPILAGIEMLNYFIYCNSIPFAGKENCWLIKLAWIIDMWIKVRICTHRTNAFEWRISEQSNKFHTLCHKDIDPHTNSKLHIKEVRFMIGIYTFLSVHIPE